MLSTIKWTKSHFAVSTDMSDYIKETTNKSLEKYKNNMNNSIVLLKNKEDLNTFLNTCSNTWSNTFLLAFVSIFSFLAGYKCKQLTN
jgi:hypothetical protein